MKNKVKELAFYMGDKSDKELWNIVRETCRIDTPSWRAYEQLYLRHSEMQKRLKEKYDGEL